MKYRIELISGNELIELFETENQFEALEKFNEFSRRRFDAGFTMLYLNSELKKKFVNTNNFPEAERFQVNEIIGNYDISEVYDELKRRGFKKHKRVLYYFVHNDLTPDSHYFKSKRGNIFFTEFGIQTILKKLLK